MRELTNISTQRFGKYGIKSCEAGPISYQAIEVARRAISKKFRRNGRIWVRVLVDIPITTNLQKFEWEKDKEILQVGLLV
ncbi:hypothetical protein O6H91_17G031400 [Diphasiastrum complanatum]|uniref:Uncharacterized protein n=1 Tax=Diphasiastrum complanatum TaxID=34168 RepID=A0ACC2B5G2_DIPCM|nr:hypothetical protein O6H91_17G031400 [Diphasiastrum complanatum]